MYYAWSVNLDVKRKLYGRDESLGVRVRERSKLDAMEIKIN